MLEAANTTASPAIASQSFDQPAKASIDLIIQTLDDTKAREMVVLDVRSRTGSLFDALVICTATSDRHAAAMAENVRTRLKRAGIGILGIEGPGEMGWTLIDAGEVVVHIMSEQAREHYDLEGLWDIP